MQQHKQNTQLHLQVPKSQKGFQCRQCECWAFKLQWQCSQSSVFIQLASAGILDFQGKSTVKLPQTMTLLIQMSAMPITRFQSRILRSLWKFMWGAVGCPLFSFILPDVMYVPVGKLVFNTEKNGHHFCTHFFSAFTISYQTVSKLKQWSTIVKVIMLWNMIHMLQLSKSECRTNKSLNLTCCNLQI